ncbi:lactonase family protein [Bacteroides fragilis]|uniref:lactonase family protein n=1 Tax=Bacteroides TaxID=816 RepID=UPI001F20F75E|nr:lactonase family protein [Bacteroides fragilis]MCF2688808.1 lactonase family protein [Bacteroides fragilis]MCY2673226.1 lactonase family protein [Bacteroides fragilis]MDA1493217.1 lactonase family protein [Bacteroides fragilis]
MVEKIISICAVGMLVASCSPKKTTAQPADPTTTDNELTMLVGTYTSGDSKGIYTFRFNEETGASVPLSDAEVANPSYLVPSDDGKFVYSVNEFSKDQASVSAFAFDKTKGTLRLLNTQKTMGADPCYLITNGKNVITANYSGGSITVFPIGKDGSLLPASDVIEFKGSGPDKERQTMPHLHCVRITPDGKYLLADDLGTDQIHKFNLNPNANADNKEKLLTKGNPEAFKVAPGSGPRHLIFSPDSKFAYLINEIGGTVIAFRYTDGMLYEIQTIAADTVNAQGSGDIHISPDGKYLYASNRLKADGIAIFKVDKTNGTLTKVGYQLTGIHPRNFIITPNGKYLLVACRDTNTIQIFERNQTTGLLTDIKKDIKVDKPVCLKFVD